MRGGGGCLPADEHLEIVSGSHHLILGLFVTQLEDIFAVNLQDGIADLQACLLGQTPDAHLEHGAREIAAPGKSTHTSTSPSQLLRRRPPPPPPPPPQLPPSAILSRRPMRIAPRRIQAFEIRAKRTHRRKSARLCKPIIFRLDPSWIVP